MEEPATPIILIGPPMAGKSTVGRLLAMKLDLPQYSLDNLRWRYYQEIGYDNALADQIVAREGFSGLYRYWKPFEAHAVERVLVEHLDGVIDFGAGHSVYEDNGLFQRVATVLAPYPNIFLILPSPDLDESVQVIRERHTYKIDGIDAHEYFVRHRSNYELATMTVYTAGKTSQEVAQEILAQIGNDAGDILLIGPQWFTQFNAGRVLAEQLGVASRVLYTEIEQYFGETDYDRAEQERLQLTEGFAGVDRYRRPYEVYGIERVLAENQSGVFIFGPNHSVQQDEDFFARLKAAVRKHRHVILLQPVPNPDEAIRILRENDRAYIDGVEMLEHFVRHHSNFDLAKQIVYTLGKTPQQTSEEIIERLQ